MREIILQYNVGLTKRHWQAILREATDLYSRPGQPPTATDQEMVMWWLRNQGLIWGALAEGCYCQLHPTDPMPECFHVVRVHYKAELAEDHWEKLLTDARRRYGEGASDEYVVKRWLRDQGLVGGMLELMDDYIEVQDLG
jgi:hypothetical protein